MFQFSPLVEHFLQSITKSQQTNANLPLLVFDPNAKTPSATDTSDLFKVILLFHNFFKAIKFVDSNKVDFAGIPR